MPRTFTVCAITGNAIAALLAPQPINLLNATVAGIVVAWHWRGPARNRSLSRAAR